MERKEVAVMMRNNKVFMDSMSISKFALLQTVQSLAQAANRSPEPIKGALSAEAGEIVCLMQWMIMMYGEGQRISLTVPMTAFGKACEMVRCDADGICSDLKDLYGEGAGIMVSTIAAWADQTLHAQLWERARAELGIAERSA